MIGNGLVEVNRPSDALMFFERAIKIAEADEDSGLPFMGYDGKAQALVALGRPDETKRVLQDALAKARSQQKRGHEAQLLIVLGRLGDAADGYPGLPGWVAKSLAAVLAKFLHIESIPTDCRDWRVNAANASALADTLCRERETQCFSERSPLSGLTSRSSTT